jgi:transketolase
MRGAYVLSAPATAPTIVIVGTGTEVDLCVDAGVVLNAEGIATQVVSMPCWALFEAQTLEYKRSVFPAGAAVLSVEAASTQGWPKYSHAQVGMSTFGASGPGGEVMAHFGFTVDNVAAKARAMAEYYAANGAAQPLIGKPF